MLVFLFSHNTLHNTLFGMCQQIQVFHAISNSWSSACCRDQALRSQCLLMQLAEEGRLLKQCERDSGKWAFVCANLRANSTGTLLF